MLELLRWAVAQSGMEPLLIVISLNEFLDVIVQMLEILVLVGVNLFPLESFDEAFTTGVVIWVGWPAHARNHLMLFQDRDVFCCRVLKSAI